MTLRRCKHLTFTPPPSPEVGIVTLIVQPTARRDGLHEEVLLCVVCAARLSNALEDVVLDRWDL